MTKETIRPPVVVVLGHVDHGKTTLLDNIRKADVAASEFGGITQHIGAYEITTKEGKKITFIDTPGHEAFSNLRKRGAELADIALLIVAADSSIQPQTIEAYKVIEESKIPFIVVINKIDLPDIRLNKVYKDLSKIGVYLEGQGGEIPKIELSAKTGQGIDSLLELISLLAEMKSLTFDYNSEVQGGIVEVKKGQGGIITTIILKNGHLKVADEVFLGEEKVRVRSLTNDKGVILSEVQPSTPFELLGAKKMAITGTKVSGKLIIDSEIDSRYLDSRRDGFKDQFFAGNEKKFNFIIKADTLGTEEVIKQKFSQFSEIKIIKSEVGELTDNDLETANTSKANILLFNVPQKKELLKQAENFGINIFSYNLIYELLDEVEDLIISLRTKEEKEAKKIGEARIMAEFVRGENKIAGLKVISGKIRLNFVGELWRGKKNLGEITIRSLNKKSVSVAEVVKGDDCGAIFSPKLDFRAGDIVKLYTQ